MKPCTPHGSAHHPARPDRASPLHHTPIPIARRSTPEQQSQLPLKPHLRRFPYRNPRVTDTEGHAHPLAATVCHKARTQPQHPPPQDGTRQLRTAPETTNPADRQNREPNPGALTAGHAAPTPRPPHDGYHTQELATVCRALDSATTTLATQRRRRSHRASHTPHNSAMTRPSHTSPTDLNSRNLPSSG